MEEDRGKAVRGLRVVTISVVAFLCLAFLLRLFYSIPLKDSLLWLIGVFILFYIPGSLLLRFLNFGNDEYFIDLFHSIALGAALMPMAYAPLRRISYPELLYPFIIAAFLLWLVFTIKDFKKVRNIVYTSYINIFTVTTVMAIMFVLLHLSYFTDVVFTAGGIKFRSTQLTETNFHLGIINTLKNTFPPFYPYASGFDFSQYHLNMHLEIEMFNRLFSIDTIKLTFFYFPFLYFCLMVFVIYILFHKFWNMQFLGSLISLLIFGSDLSFIPGFFGLFQPDVPWCILFSPTLWPIFTLNGFLPALFVMFLCVLYLKKFYESNHMRHLVCFALIGFSSYGFKSSMGLHIMGAAFLTGIAAIVFKGDREKGKLICAASALTALFMFINLILLRGSVGNNIVHIELFNRFRETLDSLIYFGFIDKPWFFYLAIFPLYVIGTFGVRLFGFYLCKDFFGRRIDPVAVFLIIFVTVGFFLSEMVFLGAPVEPPYKTNNAMWFSFQSLTGGWLLLPFFFMEINKDRKKFLVFVILIILLAFPSTAQFLSVRSNPKYVVFSSAAMEVAKFFESTPPKSVILHPMGLGGPYLSSHLAGRADVLNLHESYAVNEIGQGEAKNRFRDANLFFNTKEPTKRESVLKKYNVDYVYAPLSYSTTLDNDCFLSRVLKNREYVVYKIAGDIP